MINANPINDKILRYAGANGKLAAEQYKRFAGAYKIRTGMNGTQVSPSPDGRATGTCDRCGTAIMNIYVFSDNHNETMHVGIDCAAQMGVPLPELRRARAHWRQVEREAAAKASAEKSAERRARWEAERLAAAEANREANAELVKLLEGLRNNPACTDFETRRLSWYLGCVERGNADVFADETSDEAMGLGTIVTRLGLCATSTAQTWEKRRTLTLKVYRRAISWDGMYGRTYVNFLYDVAAGNAYVYKGSTCVGMIGETLELVASHKGTDERDGLTATVIQRPKILKTLDEQGNSIENAEV